MTKYEIYPPFLDFFEYHGNTSIKLIRKKAGKTIWKDWIVFDSADAALDYFNSCCGD